jgi:hypothetical protein
VLSPLLSSHKNHKVSTVFQKSLPQSPCSLLGAFLSLKYEEYLLCLLSACASKILAINSLYPLSAQNETITAPWLVLFSLFQKQSCEELMGSVWSAERYSKIYQETGDVFVSAHIIILVLLLKMNKPSKRWLLLFSFFRKGRTPIHGVCMECWEIIENIPRNR